MAKKSSSLLKEYNRKRDFTKTKEPSGALRRGKKKGHDLIFVVQEHHARRLHYDFRLELDGVLKSWAVPKGPSLDPSDKRLAVQTEDHPLSYAQFHGTIPKGEYGGGEVFIWDKGTWTPEGDPKAGLKKGHLEFKLTGGRLNGKFILIRTRFNAGQSKNNWLLIKRHDEETASETGKKIRSPKKEVKQKSRAVDPWPGFIAPQLPRLLSSPPDEAEWIHEMKFDGYRMQAHLKSGVGHLYTRTGLDWSNSFPFVMEGLSHLEVDDAILDGEVVAVNQGGRSDFQKLQGLIKDKNDKGLRYYVFDLLYLNGQDLRQLPLVERKEKLAQILKGAPSNIILSEHFYENGQKFYQASCDMHMEGMISKLADSPYLSGRNDYWVKTKCGARQEFVIGGWSEPRGTRTGIGSLLLGVYDGNELRYCGRVGTGMDQKDLRDLKRILSALEKEDSPFDKNSPRGSDIHWVEPEKVCEVSFSQWTQEKLLRTPVFQGLRQDKPASEIIQEKPSQKRKKLRKKADGIKALSSPGKILFKEEGITKKEIAEFYSAISKSMLPYLRDRPLSLVRCPQGSEGKCFFQKHITGQVPESFHTFPVPEDDGEGIYLAVDSKEGLHELVQLNAFEIHTWNCDKNEIMRPNQIVMDFDPGPGVSWSSVVKAAFELKDILENLGLKSFAKLTGGKGIHVHIPLAPFYDWDQIKSFAQALAQEMVSRHPELYVANMSKKLRHKKIFIDYLRNGFGATAVAPYSLRARPTSAVAMPLTWEELKKVKGSDVFTLEKALKKIKSRKRDPWEGMLKLKQKIDILGKTKKKTKAA